MVYLSVRKTSIAINWTDMNESYNIKKLNRLFKNRTLV